MRTVGLATCSQFPDLEPPERLLIEPLAARGLQAIPAVWDDPAVDWSAFDVVVNRGTWDYAERLDAFLEWVDAVEAACGLLNPPPVVRWNVDKRYLAELAANGVPTVPTSFVRPGEAFSPPAAGGYVVKPTISAGSRNTARYTAGTDDDVAAAHAQRLHADDREVMVQPYLERVDEMGETALLYLDGTFSHAISKAALLRAGQPPTEELFAAETIDPRTPDARELAVGEQVIRWLGERFGQLLYARVDLLASDAGPVVLEVELIEPSLFLDTDHAAPDRLAAAIADRV